MQQHKCILSSYATIISLICAWLCILIYILRTYAHIHFLANPFFSFFLSLSFSLCACERDGETISNQQTYGRFFFYSSSHLFRRRYFLVCVWFMYAVNFNINTLLIVFRVCVCLDTRRLELVRKKYWTSDMKTYWHLTAKVVLVACDATTCNVFSTASVWNIIHVCLVPYWSHGLSDFVCLWTCHTEFYVSFVIIALRYYDVVDDRYAPKRIEKVRRRRSEFQMRMWHQSFIIFTRFGVVTGASQLMNLHKTKQTSARVQCASLKEHVKINNLCMRSGPREFASALAKTVDKSKQRHLTIECCTFKYIHIYATPRANRPACAAHL